MGLVKNIVVMDIENEVRVRVDFKMNELLTAIENGIKRNWHIAFIEGSQKHSNYMEAFKQIKQMFKKELHMATPYDNMAEQKQKKVRDIAVDKILDTFNARTRRDYHHVSRRVANIVEDAQFWQQ